MLCCWLGSCEGVCARDLRLQGLETCLLLGESRCWLGVLLWDAVFGYRLLLEGG